MLDLLVLVLGVGVDEPLSELLHQLSERVMLELIVLVQGEELATILLRDRVEGQADQVIRLVLLLFQAFKV